jgi:hypothetical protein
MNYPGTITCESSHSLLWFSISKILQVERALEDVQSGKRRERTILARTTLF